MWSSVFDSQGIPKVGALLGARLGKAFLHWTIRALDPHRHRGLGGGHAPDAHSSDDREERPAGEPERRSGCRSGTGEGAQIRATAGRRSDRRLEACEASQPAEARRADEGSDTAAGLTTAQSSEFEASRSSRVPGKRKAVQVGETSYPAQRSSSDRGKGGEMVGTRSDGIRRVMTKRIALAGTVVVLAASLSQISVPTAGADGDGAPTITSAIFNNTGISVTWTPALPPAGVTDISYYMLVSLNGGVTSETVDASVADDPDEVDCPVYEGNPNICSYQIGASGFDFSTNPVTGWSESSAWVPVTPQLEAPVINSATFTNTGVALDISPPSLPSGATVEGYDVEVTVDNGSPEDLGVYPPGNPVEVWCPISVPNLCAYQAEALIGNPGDPVFGSPYSTLVPVTPQLEAPVINSATFTNTGVALDISPPSLPSGATVEGYDVEVTVDNGSPEDLGVYPPGNPVEVWCPISVPNLCAYQAEALIGNPGDPVFGSPYSTLVPVTPQLEAPVINSATFTNTGVALDISPPSLPSGATVEGYDVEVTVDNGSPEDLGVYPPGNPVEVWCPISVPNLCSYQAEALIGNPGDPIFYSPFSDPVAGVSQAPLDSTAIASGDAARHPTSCTQTRYPVNCASGDFWHTFTDRGCARAWAGTPPYSYLQFAVGFEGRHVRLRVVDRLWNESDH